MQLRKLLYCLLIGVVFVLIIVPSVHAQTTSMTVQSSPSSVVLRSDGAASFDTTVQVSYAGLVEQTSQLEVLTVALMYYGLTTSPNGTADSTPDSCIQLDPGVTNCTILFPTGGSGTETVSFHAIIYNAAPQRYHFELLAGFVAATAGKPTTLNSSVSYAYFYVSVRNQVTLSITTPSQVAVTLDNVTQNSGPVTLTVSPGTHMISVPQTVGVAVGSQLTFDHWSDGSTQASRTVDLEDDTNLTAIYVTQYSLKLTDPAASGSGWYNQGSIAEIFVPSSEPCQGITGVLGCTKIFQGWYENGGLVASTNSASIKVTGPQTLDTQWMTNMTEPIVIITLIVVAIGATIAVAVKRSYGKPHRKRRKRSYAERHRKRRRSRK